MMTVATGHALGSIPPKDHRRFSSKIAPYFNISDPNTCFVWCGTTSRGYGQFWYQGRNHWAHRIAYSAYVGDIPPGKDVHHKCKNKLCVRGDHLELVDRVEHGKNERDYQRKSETYVTPVVRQLRKGKECPRVTHQSVRRELRTERSCGSA